MSVGARRRVFIGSSAESINIAFALQKGLEHATDPTVWNQGIFSLTSSSLQSLIQALDQFDYAIFLFTPDDIALMRGDRKNIVRDNVIFEMGLFLGRLGPSRCSIVSPRDAEDLHLPSDLLGIVRATYNSSRSDGNIEAALGPVVFQVLRSIG